MNGSATAVPSSWYAVALPTRYVYVFPGANPAASDPSLSTDPVPRLNAPVTETWSLAFAAPGFALPSRTWNVAPGPSTTQPVARVPTAAAPPGATNPPRATVTAPVTPPVPPNVAPP